MPAETKNNFLLCWSCRTPLAGGILFCPACGIVQPPSDMSPFARLGLPEQFPLENSTLEQAVVTAQRQFHPDRFTRKSGREQLLAEQHAMAVNQAATTLRDPVRRGQALLQSRGHPVNDKETVQDHGILMESLEHREQLADASTQVELDALHMSNRQQQQQCEQTITTAFTQANHPLAARELLRLRYLQRFAEDIRDKRASFTK